MSLYMNDEMAKRLDPVFPEAGGLMHLEEVRKRSLPTITNPHEKAGDTSFHPSDVIHIRKALGLLGGDDEAKAALMSWLAFAQMKDTVARLG